jgi:uncharacterized RDD family membrane protein YckC
MKCPKCSYLSFEAGERCRNCGYDFSMSAPESDDPAGDLPLFDDRPLVSVPASPRPPLSVRRTTQDPARLRSRQAPPVPPPAPAEEPNFEFELDLGEEAGTAGDRSASIAPPDPAIPAASAQDRAAESGDPRVPAPAVRRLVAAVIDVALIAGIDAAVVYFTLRLAGLDFAQFFILPIVPLGSFLLLLNGGYFVMFTASTGQTIGKMATGIRVVGTSVDDVINDRVSFARAALRTAGYLGSLLPAGLGFIPAFIGPRDHRALHDRLAETRVVRA